MPIPAHLVDKKDLIDNILRDAYERITTSLENDEYGLVDLDGRPVLSYRDMMAVKDTVEDLIKDHVKDNPPEDGEELGTEMYVIRRSEIFEYNAEALLAAIPDSSVIEKYVNTKFVANKTKIDKAVKSGEIDESIANDCKRLKSVSVSFIDRSKVKDREFCIDL